nr:MAG TPA: hypothetical protein [Caudoviricetes sp.]
MIGRGPPLSVWSVQRTAIDGRALGRHVLTDPAQLLTDETYLIDSIVTLTLSTGIGAILSRLNRSQTLTDLPRQLIHVITEIGAVVIRDLLPRGLRGLVYGIDPALETGRESLELDRDHTADRDPESRERGDDLGCGHDGDQGVCSGRHLSSSSRGVGVVTSSHQSIRPVGFRAV